MDKRIVFYLTYTINTSSLLVLVASTAFTVRGASSISIAPSYAITASIFDSTPLSQHATIKVSSTEVSKRMIGSASSLSRMIGSSSSPSRSSDNFPPSRTLMTMNNTFIYQLMLKFYVAGKLPVTYIRTLNNQYSSKSDNTSINLTSKLKRMLELFELFDIKLDQISYSSSSVFFNGTFYFKIDSQITTSMLTRLLQEDDTFPVINVTVSENCVMNTCSGKNGKCKLKNGTASCICNHGYRGHRCSVEFAVYGTMYVTWKNLTNCNSSCNNEKMIQIWRCFPEPVNGGVCLVGPLLRKLLLSCNSTYCDRTYSDDDYVNIALIFLGMVLTIVVLGIAFCYAFKFTASNISKDKSTAARYSVEGSKQNVSSYVKSTNQLRPSVITLRNIDNTIPLHGLRASGVEIGKNNKGFNEDGEGIYRKQLKKFLEEAPQMRLNNINIRKMSNLKRSTPPLNKTSGKEKVNNTDNIIKSSRHANKINEMKGSSSKSTDKVYKKKNVRNKYEEN